jgi:hypothetical protein
MGPDISIVNTHNRLWRYSYQAQYIVFERIKTDQAVRTPWPSSKEKARVGTTTLAQLRGIGPAAILRVLERDC